MCFSNIEQASRLLKRAGRSFYIYFESILKCRKKELDLFLGYTQNKRHSEADAKPQLARERHETIIRVANNDRSGVVLPMRVFVNRMKRFSCFEGKAFVSIRGSNSAGLGIIASQVIIISGLSKSVMATQLFTEDSTLQTLIPVLNRVLNSVPEKSP